MNREELPEITYKIDISQQVNDGLLTSEDVISWLKDKMKVRRSKVIAQRVLNFDDQTNAVVLKAKKSDVLKKNLKQYIKRYLRCKSLSNFVKPHGIEEGFKLDYINKIDDAADMNN